MKDWHDLQAYFNQRVSQIVEKHGKKMVGWDEVLHPELPQSIVVQSWRGASFLAESSRKGYRGILSSGYYLDHIRPAGFHYQKEPLPADSTQPRGSGADLGRRSLPVGRARRPGNHRVADLAADRGHCRAFLVAARGDRRQGDVPPHGCAGVRVAGTGRDAGA